jgi:three-Cys-motif partner protein
VTKKDYGWHADGSPVPIAQHSVAKHEVLEAYLVEYLQTLVSSPHQDKMRVTLVDGFAGGGAYVHEDTGERVFGSPFVFLDAVKTAEALINLHRTKPVQMEVDYIFVEKSREGVSSLTHNLQREGHGARGGADIQLHHGSFENHAQSVIDFIHKKSPKVGRSLFLLDQYGYSDVPVQMIRNILGTLPRSEVILTFAVDSFINFVSDGAKTRKTLQAMGIPDVFQGRSIRNIKADEPDFRLFIQSRLYRSLIEGTGAQYYTVFFIRTAGHGDYWLVHLSQHPKARDVMTGVHWRSNNDFLHYGGAGIDMFQGAVLGYHTRKDDDFTGQGALAFEFDDPAGEASIKALMEQLPRRIHAHDAGLTFGELFATTCNTSPADSSKYKDALERLIELKEIDAFSPDGARRRKATTLNDADRLTPSRQTKLFIGD